MTDLPWDAQNPLVIMCDQVLKGWNAKGWSEREVVFADTTAFAEGPSCLMPGEDLSTNPERDSELARCLTFSWRYFRQSHPECLARYSAFPGEVPDVRARNPFYPLLERMFLKFLDQPVGESFAALVFQDLETAELTFIYRTPAGQHFLITPCMHPFEGEAAKTYQQIVEETRATQRPPFSPTTRILAAVLLTN